MAHDLRQRPALPYRVAAKQPLTTHHSPTSRRPACDSPNRHPRRRAFTLVEVLAVIVIIGILMALLLPAVQAARVKALEARMISGDHQLDAAMKQFRTNYAVLPPALHRRQRLPLLNEPAENACGPSGVPGPAGTTFGIPTDTPLRDGRQGRSTRPKCWSSIWVEFPAHRAPANQTTGFNMNPLNPRPTGGSEHAAVPVRSRPAVRRGWRQLLRILSASQAGAGMAFHPTSTLMPPRTAPSLTTMAMPPSMARPRLITTMP